MNPEVYQVLITTLGGIVLAYLQLRHGRELAKVKVITEEARAAGNSLLGVQLELVAIALERIAIMEKSEGNTAAATAARESYKVHMVEQTIIKSKRERCL